MPITIEEFLKNASEEQKNTLVEISDLAEQEHTYTQKINTAIEAVNGKGVYSSDGVSLTLCEDEDDFAVITANDRMKLQRIRKRISEIYDRAINLGMGDLGIIQRHYEHYVGKPLSS
jgi:hypothetical protein